MTGNWRKKVYWDGLSKVPTTIQLRNSVAESVAEIQKIERQIGKKTFMYNYASWHKLKVKQVLKYKYE